MLNDSLLTVHVDQEEVSNCPLLQQTQARTSRLPTLGIYGRIAAVRPTQEATAGSLMIDHPSSLRVARNAQVTGAPTLTLLVPIAAATRSAP